jgi:carboxymethylenebutenolidase
MTETVKLHAADGHELDAYVARPAADPIAGLVVIQEAFGVNHHIRSVADSFAREGFLAVAPALFDRQQRNVELGYDPADIQQGVALARQINIADAVKDVDAALEFSRKSAGGSGGGIERETGSGGESGGEFQKMSGVIGYCLGGTLAWLAATRLTPDAAVGYYGGRIAQYAEENPRCPVMLHFGALDKHIPKPDIDRVQAAHSDLQTDLEIFWYEAGHGFNCNERASYDAHAAEQARHRSLQFLKKHLC